MDVLNLKSDPVIGQKDVLDLDVISMTHLNATNTTMKRWVAAMSIGEL